MFNFYEFEKRVRQEADTLNSTLRDEKIHDLQRSKAKLFRVIIFREKRGVGQELQDESRTFYQRCNVQY